jgi:hypothetical protein
VLARLLKDGMSVERALASIRREFFLDRSSGFVYDVLRDRAGQLDMAAQRLKALEHFSGTLCVEELHLGRFILLLATDPLSDLPVSGDQAITAADGLPSGTVCFGCSAMRDRHKQW